jgi:excinuclease ABC subunit C
MKNDATVTNIFDLEGRRYPHFKITKERFPRVLATRAIEDDGAEYFGAFLPKTAARILIDYLNRRFRLRSCDIDIDGTFPMPCTQYYRHRCLAPCVAKLCSSEKYYERVELVRLFLANDRRRFRAMIKSLIATNSENLDFEEAAIFRDILESAERHWKQPRWQMWLDDAVDTYEIEETPIGFAVYLTTTRNRTVLGRKVFDITREDAETPDEALSQIISDFYVCHLPKEIRVPVDFYDRKKLIADLSERFERDVVIRVARGRTVTAARSAIESHNEHEIDRARPRASAEKISRELRNIFGLTKLPKRVEAFDVAHISATGFVAASSVWENGRYLSADYQFIISGQNSELDALADAVVRTVLDAERKKPDLILVDGGKNHLNKVRKALDSAGLSIDLVAAVKPRQKHSSIASFLTTDGDPAPFDIDSPAHAMLLLLRDEAHDLANRAHRDYREMMPFYEKAGFEKPLVVPLRFHAENGGAEDLIPIDVRG